MEDNVYRNFVEKPTGKRPREDLDGDGR